MNYDYIIVGAGLFGAVFAQRANAAGRKCLVVEKRNHLGGNIYTEERDGIQVHKYGAHIFHTNNDAVWDYVNHFASFNNYINSPLAHYKGKIYNLPFNMNTFYQMWGVTTPAQAKKMIEAQRAENYVEKPENLEQMAINLVGWDIYETLIRGYTEKQWGRPCRDLPPSIIRRLPVRFVFDNNYFSANHQGIPIGGYTEMIKRMLDGIEVMLNIDYLDSADELRKMAQRVIFTGPIDAYFRYCYGPLEYRSLRFETSVLNIENYQGNAVVNYTDVSVPHMRIIEHKHFDFGKQPKTVITHEYSLEWTLDTEPYYPIENEHNLALFSRYIERAQNEENVVFCGRLGSYQYLDMDQVVEKALNMPIR